MRIVINRETCIRAGKCYFEHPTLLAEDGDGFPVPLLDVTAESQRAAVMDAIENCPTGSISIEDADGAETS